MLLALASCARMPVPAALPPKITSILPVSCKQVLHVTAPDDQSTSAQLRMLQRASTGTWSVVGETIPVRIGRHGLAWGAGEPVLPAPAGVRIKKEGDGCAPIGIFRITQAFGSEPAPSGIKLPYLRCTAHHVGIDDVRSRFYNQIVDDREVACDWTSPETMIPSSGCYKLGAVIAHNPQNRPGLGSCIFMHLWQGETIPTSGCTAMSEPHLRKVVTWLDPAADPRLVQLVEPR